MQAQDWEALADSSRRIGRVVEYHPTIGSTNDRARQALREPDGDGLAVVADLQTSGRGRHGRAWLSPPGTNLMVSVGLRPTLPRSAAGWLGAAAALAARSACARVAPEAGVAVRWPNDIVDGAGRKIAGVLIETAFDGERMSELIIGIGINANWRRAEMPPEVAERAISLADLANAEVDRRRLLAHLLSELDVELAALSAGASPIERLRGSFWLTGRSVRVETGEGELEGVVGGVAEDGALVLDRADGAVTLTVGEVVAVRDPVVA